MPDIVEFEIRQAIARLGFSADGALSWTSNSQRLYSDIHILEIKGSGGPKKFLLKSGGLGLPRNMALNEVAREACLGSLNFFQPGMTRVESSGSILTEFFEGESLSKKLKFRFRQNPLDWHRRLLTSVGLAGEWLRRFHNTTTEQRDIAPLLTSYVANRPERLVLLSKQMQNDLLQIVDRPALTTCSVSHGDFTPQNILIGDNSLCVIDFGVREWDVMAPEWDLASLIVGMKRASMFSPVEVVKWLPFLMKECVGEFLQTYGLEVRQREFMTFLALRHFTYFPVENGSADPAKWDRRSKWHYNEFCSILDKLRVLE